MLPHDFKALQHTLADGDAGHNNDEFLEAVALVQFKNRAEVDVCLASAGLHLDRELTSLKRTSALDAVALLHSTNIRQKLRIIQHQVIADPVLRKDDAARRGRTDLEGRLSERLTVEHIRDRAYGVRLVGERRIELELHHGSGLKPF